MTDNDKDQKPRNEPKEGSSIDVTSLKGRSSKEDSSADYDSSNLPSGPGPEPESEDLSSPVAVADSSNLPSGPGPEPESEDLSPHVAVADSSNLPSGPGPEPESEDLSPHVAGDDSDRPSGPGPEPESEEGKEQLKPDSELSSEEVEKLELKKEISRIDRWVSVGAENGLYQIVGNKDKYKETLDFIKEARLNLRSNCLVETETKTSYAINLYSDAVQTTSQWWRFSNIYAGPIWIYLVGFLGLIAAFYFSSYATPLTQGKLISGVEDAGVYAVTWGAIGGILRGLWFLKDKVGDRRFRKAWRIYFISVPFLGGIFGAIVYFIIIATLIAYSPTSDSIASSKTPTENGESSDAPASEPDETSAPASEPDGQQQQAGETIREPLLIIPLAALAGFNWEWIVMIFKKIGEAFAPSDKGSFQRLLEEDLTKLDR